MKNPTLAKINNDENAFLLASFRLRDIFDSHMHKLFRTSVVLFAKCGQDATKPSILPLVCMGMAYSFINSVNDRSITVDESR